ncbi:MAG TPA: hypothetical protein VH325_03035 [Bryobacteraceae bacterium]|nr:hypothetical protein [Bryobacteraceae bacterium]
MSTPVALASKTTVTSQTMLMPADELPAYEAHLARFFAEFAPETTREKELTQYLADTQWRVNRTMALHMGIFALGHRQLAEEFSSEPDPVIRKSLIDAQIYLKYERQFKSLSTEENRLCKQFETDRTELKAVIAKRVKDHRKQIGEAFELYENAQDEGLPFNPAELGFEFSTDYLLKFNDEEWKRIHVREGNYYTWVKEQQRQAA